MDFLGMSFRLFTFAGINVHLHMTYIIFALFQVSEDARGGAQGILNGVVWLGLLFAVVLCHEFGHCFGARSVGGDPRHILMWPLGGLAFADAPMRLWPQFVTVACGPLVNVAFCVLSGAIIAATGQFKLGLLYYCLPVIAYHGSTTLLQYLGLFYSINLFLFAFNMLPFFPMDGGQLLRCALWAVFGYGRATIYACYIGIIGAAFFIAWGLGLLGGPPQMMLVMIAVFGGYTCFQELSHTSPHSVPVDEFRSADYVMIDKRRTSWWSRWFGKKRTAARANPNPGGWQRAVDAREQRTREIDRILKKVHEQGMHTLTYIERQMLEQATREQRDRDRGAPV